MTCVEERAGSRCIVVVREALAISEFGTGGEARIHLISLGLIKDDFVSKDGLLLGDR